MLMPYPFQQESVLWYIPNTSSKSGIDIILISTCDMREPNRNREACWGRDHSGRQKYATPVKYRVGLLSPVRRDLPHISAFFDIIRPSICSGLLSAYIRVNEDRFYGGCPPVYSLSIWGLKYSIFSRDNSWSDGERCRKMPGSVLNPWICRGRCREIIRIWYHSVYCPDHHKPLMPRRAGTGDSPHMFPCDSWIRPPLFPDDF